MKNTLDSIVREWLFESGNTEAKYARALSISMSCLRTMNLDVSGQPVAQLVDVNANDTIDLPLDYISITSIGIYDGLGNVRPLLPSFFRGKDVKTDDCGDIVVPKGENPNNQDTVLWGDSSQQHYAFGQSKGGFFGAGGGQSSNGYYRMNEEKGYIALEGYRGGSQVYLEYLSDIKRIKGNFIIHIYLIDSIKANLDWKMINNNVNVPMNQKEVARRNYLAERKKAVARYNSFTKDELLQSFRKGNKLSPKF